MPELPEVETVLRGIRGRIRGRRILKAEAFTRKLRIAVPRDFAEKLEGRRVTALSRRAKFLRLHLDSGQALLLHLGMSGSVRIGKSATPYRREKHDHALLEFEGNVRLVFNDPRRFGLLAFGEAAALDAHLFFKNLGPEPLGEDFSGAALKKAFAGRRLPVKLALCDQKNVAGVGNIYASEALYRARIHPSRPASSLSGAEAGRLARAVQAVLASAIAAGGSSLRDYRRADGELGAFQHRFQVYERDGKRCRRKGCPGTIRRIVQGARSTYYCPACPRAK